MDHTKRTTKSLDTRLRLGITKSSQIKGGETRRNAGHYEKLANTMQGHWEKNSWNNQEPRGEWILYKNTGIGYQGSYEYEFLQDLESANGLQWLIDNVKRGPSIWYTDSKSGKKRLYISDFIIDNTIYEIKSSYTWNRKGGDKNLETLNRSKLDECITQGYSVVLVLDKKEIKYEKSVD